VRVRRMRLVASFYRKGGPIDKPFGRYGIRPRGVVDGRMHTVRHRVRTNRDAAVSSEGLRRRERRTRTGRRRARRPAPFPRPLVWAGLVVLAVSLGLTLFFTGGPGESLGRVASGATPSGSGAADLPSSMRSVSSPTPGDPSVSRPTAATSSSASTGPSQAVLPSAAAKVQTATPVVVPQPNVIVGHPAPAVAAATPSPPAVSEASASSAPTPTSSPMRCSPSFPLGLIGGGGCR
jgi:hypothetical protein